MRDFLLHKHKVPMECKGKHRRALRLAEGLGSLVSVDAQPFFLAVSMCFGAVIYFQFSFEPPFVLVILTFCAAVAVWLLVRAFSKFLILNLVIVIGIGLSAGILFGSWRASRVASPVIGEITGPLMLEGWVQAIEQGDKGPRVRIRVHAASGLSEKETPKFVRLTHRSALEVSPGRFVRCWSVLRPPPGPELARDYDFRRQAWFAQLGGVGYVQGRCRGGTLGAPRSQADKLRLRIGSFRRKLASHTYTVIGEPAGGFAAALVSGDRSYMTSADQEALRRSGLAHLLAISGLHMGIVGGLVFVLSYRLLGLIEPLVLRLTVKKPAAVIALLASASYLILSGASVSTQRAFIMSMVVFGAVLFDRAAISLRSYAIAMILIVVMQPESVMSPGFQMSFAASGALIATYEAWNRRRAVSPSVMGQISYSWVSLIVTSIVAFAATAPFALYHFGRLSGFGLLANFLAMPVISFLSAPAAALTLLMTPFGAADTGLRLFGKSLELVLAIAHYFGDSSHATSTLNQPLTGSVLVCISLALAVAMIAKGGARWGLAAVMLVPAGLFWLSAPPEIVHWSASGAVYVRTPSGEIRKIDYLEGEALGPISYSEAKGYEGCQEFPCSVSTLAGQIWISAPDAPTPCIDSSRAILHLVPGNRTSEPHSPGCAPHLYWSDIAQSGGLTIKLGKDGTLLMETPAACGKRPWHPCRKTYS